MGTLVAKTAMDEAGRSAPELVSVEHSQALSSICFAEICCREGQYWSVK